jgi:hypothetical protein
VLTVNVVADAIGLVLTVGGAAIQACP